MQMLTMEQCIWNDDVVSIRNRNYKRITKDEIKSIVTEICKQGKHQYGSGAVEINTSILEQILTEKLKVEN